MKLTTAILVAQIRKSAQIRNSDAHIQQQRAVNKIIRTIENTLRIQVCLWCIFSCNAILTATHCRDLFVSFFMSISIKYICKWYI